MRISRSLSLFVLLLLSIVQCVDVERFVFESFHRHGEEWINHTRATLNFHFILYILTNRLSCHLIFRGFFCFSLSLSLFLVLCVSVSVWVLFLPILCLPVCCLFICHSSNTQRKKITEVTGLFFVHCKLSTMKHLNWFNWPDRFQCACARVSVCVCVNASKLTHSVNKHMVIVIILLFLLFFLLSSWHVILIGVQLVTCRPRNRFYFQPKIKFQGSLCKQINVWVYAHAHMVQFNSLELVPKEGKRNEMARKELYAAVDHFLRVNAYGLTNDEIQSTDRSAAPNLQYVKMSILNVDSTDWQMSS